MRRLELVFEPKLSEVRIVLDTITALMRACNVPDTAQADLNIVLSEMLSNSIRHGYRGADGWLGCSVDLREAHLECRVTDGARPFDPPLTEPAPDPRDLREGGYGWSLILSLADGFQYQRKDGCNELRFRIPFVAKPAYPA